MIKKRFTRTPRPAVRVPDDPDREVLDDGGHTWLSGKLILAVFPFALLVLFLLLDWWIRGRS